MIQIREVIVVEGRYDKNAVAQAVDCTIVETAGFGIFSDSEKLDLLRRLAEKRGLIILTDGDGAGFVIRNYLKGALRSLNIKHAYIPDLYGREKRKRAPSKEGKLGVEGMTSQTIVDALLRAGATCTEENSAAPPRMPITKTDLYEKGLSGTPQSGLRRRQLLKELQLPEHLTANGLLQVLNALYTREEFFAISF